MLRLGIDCMGGDKGSKEVIKAIEIFLQSHDDVEIYAFGKKDELVFNNSKVHVIDCKEVVKMDDGPLEVLKKKNSSMYQAILYLKDGHIDALVSSGSTGGFLATSTMVLKTIPGIKRAALVTAFPTMKKEKKVVLLDVGANNENSASELVQFAMMGKLYSNIAHNIKEPSVYLLSNGSEEHKGSPEGQAAFKILKETNFPNFKGNIEAKEVLLGEADVIVTDGYSGNILLKSTEGTAKMMSHLLKAAFKKNIFASLGYLLSKAGINDMKETMNYKNTGGALLLGINGVVVKAHGSSDSTSFNSAMNIAYNLVKKDIVNQIKNGIENEKY